MTDDMANEMAEEKIELKVSRMDPMETYEAGAVAQQILDHTKKADKLEEDAKNFLAAARTERQKAKELDTLLTKINQRDKARKKAGG